ncbi:hypothetical protein D3C81_741000 [compost metagenome]
MRAESGTPLVQSIQIAPDLICTSLISASTSLLVGKHEKIISACTACSNEAAFVPYSIACCLAFSKFRFHT